MKWSVYYQVSRIVHIFNHNCNIMTSQHKYKVNVSVLTSDTQPALWWSWKQTSRARVEALVRLLGITDGKLSCQSNSKEALVSEEEYRLCGSISGFTAQSDITSCDNRMLGQVQDYRKIWMGNHRQEPHTGSVHKHIVSSIELWDWNWIDYWHFCRCVIFNFLLLLSVPKINQTKQSDVRRVGGRIWGQTVFIIIGVSSAHLQEQSVQTAAQPGLPREDRVIKG